MTLRFVFIALLSGVVLVGCSDDSDAIATPQQSSQALTILVTNDDGIGAPGIDALVNGLWELDDVEVELVAPAENQSGSSDNTTDGDLVSEDSATISGYSGVAVYGYPADAVTSGTVGAARTAARAGYPAVAASASAFAEYADYDAAVEV